MRACACVRVRAGVGGEGGGGGPHGIADYALRLTVSRASVVRRSRTSQLVCGRQPRITPLRPCRPYRSDPIRRSMFRWHCCWAGAAVRCALRAVADRHTMQACSQHDNTLCTSMPGCCTYDALGCYQRAAYNTASSRARAHALTPSCACKHSCGCTCTDVESTAMRNDKDADDVARALASSAAVVCWLV